jgi:glycosyltransferase involved in cell wall biosynthesis
MPGFSLIIPFKTGISYLRECLNSALLQTHEDFEIIILADNTSNQDGALDAVLALKDARIRIEASTENLNILENWGRIKDLPKKEFMTILGYDDLLSKDFLKLISSMIQEDPEASLYHTHFNYIDSVGNTIKPCLPLPERLSAELYLTLSLQDKISVMATGYVFRSEDYDRLGGICTNYPNLIYADLQLWLELSRISYLKVSPQIAFSFRIHASVTKTSKNSIILDAFLVYLHYLKQLIPSSYLFEIALKNWGQDFVNNSTRAMVHRLLKTEKKYRGQLRIQDILNSIEPAVLELGLTFQPNQIKGIQPAVGIDRYSLIHQLFLRFQKLRK